MCCGIERSGEAQHTPPELLLGASVGSSGRIEVFKKPRVQDHLAVRQLNVAALTQVLQLFVHTLPGGTHTRGQITLPHPQLHTAIPRRRAVRALAVAVLLGVAQWGGWLATFPRSRVLAYLGQISYSVFLLNFPIGLVVNAAFTRFAPADPVVQTLGVLLAWLACNLLGALFHHAVEVRLGRLGQLRRPPAAAGGSAGA